MADYDWFVYLTTKLHKWQYRTLLGIWPSLGGYLASHNFWELKPRRTPQSLGAQYTSPLNTSVTETYQVCRLFLRFTCLAASFKSCWENTPLRKNNIHYHGNL